ncbi:MAG: precorrin-6A/cobalt-precorrin-6A reductase [Oleiphilaceae bacterium]|jgi:precorrin-6A/cobalt-precorrin-6A reductase
MKILILGGTADGRHLAAALHKSGCTVVYSIAGLVRQPVLECEVISGGFTQFGGLTRYLKNQGIAAVLDVTHPYAKVMSFTARESTQLCGIPCWRFHRPSWRSELDDDWQHYQDWPELLKDLQLKKRVFLTAGQLPELAMKAFESLGTQGQKQMLRTAVKPKNELPASITWHKAIGPFSLEHEREIMVNHQVDALVTKNSGGTSMQAKLLVARELNIPVFMFTRPDLPDVDKEFVSKSECQRFIEQWLTTHLSANEVL